MTTMKPNAERMQRALAFVEANPGTTMRSAIYHVLQSFDEAKREKPTAYKQAASVIERIIKDRHVRQDSDQRLHPWDPKRKAYAEALERAMNTAPTPRERATMLAMVCEAWRAAGDEWRARTLVNIHAQSH